VTATSDAGLERGAPSGLAGAGPVPDQARRMRRGWPALVLHVPDSMSKRQHHVVAELDVGLGCHRLGIGRGHLAHRLGFGALHPLS